MFLCKIHFPTLVNSFSWSMWSPMTKLVVPIKAPKEGHTDVRSLTISELDFFMADTSVSVSVSYLPRETYIFKHIYK